MLEKIINYNHMKQTLIILSILFSLCVKANETQTIYLSGKGLGDTKTWQFYCSDGMNSKKWSKIEVPSQWELQGFGEYSYGRWYVRRNREKPPMETGTYKTTFQIPSSWKDKQVSIVFEGVMTDTDVLINGKSAGETHQGGFNRFSYDITDLIKTGKNDLHVEVSKESSDASVSNAERKADWWIFGGIYRPVYLEVKPAINIERIAVDAKADGSFYADIFTTPLEDGYTVKANISPVKDNKEQINRAQQSATLKAGTEHAVRFKWDNIEVWNTETPNLYVLTLELVDKNNNTVHVSKERIGFRTVEFRAKDGLYVNGTKVVLKGINRHSFHPDGGRTTSKEISIMDGKLIKEMNINAVRFHYAPDKHFMDVCDSLGIFVISELAGWQTAYNTKTGSKLLKSLVTRDVNHPSILIWSNGNEGGFNYDLTSMYAKYDPQKRHVIHAWADFDNFDTHHYPTFLTGIARFTNGYKVFMPAEFQHGLYDQGHGAGLEDFWANYSAHPLFAGGIMWDFSDNAVKRVDKGGILDSDGSNGPDGIVGPYREKEGSFYTVRDVWAPIQFENIFITSSFNGEFIVRNDYLFSNLNTCKMRYRVLTAPSPLKSGQTITIASGNVSLPAIDPREAGRARMQVPGNFFDGDILEITAWDQHDNEICTWTWPIHYAGEYTQKQLKNVAQTGQASVKQDGSKVTLSAKDLTVTFDTISGYITSINNSKGAVSFNNGPIPVGMKARVKDVKFRQEGANAVFTAYYLGAVDSIRWTMTPSGLLQMYAVTLNKANPGVGFDEAVFEDNINNFGFTFSYPEEKVKSMDWFGRGPYRVWKNRIRGANYGVWGKDYNNTMTGADFSNLVYPEFKGFHGNMYWSTLNTDELPLTVYSASDGIFMRVFTPAEPTDNITNWSANPEFPEGDISFLYEIPAIRCFKPASQQGPKSQPSNIRIKKGDEGVHMDLWFDFNGK